MARTYDILLDSDGDLPHRLVLGTGLDLVLQRVRIRIGRFLGEWMLDTDAGLPWLRWLQDKPPDPVAIGSRIRREIEETAGVLRVEGYGANFDRSTRTISVSGTIVAEEEQRARFSVRLDRDSANAAPWIAFHSVSS